MSTERPILFSGLMVRAILRGRKTQTRRVVKRQPDRHLFHLECLASGEWRDEEISLGKCPYGQPGDRLWVRETFANLGDYGISYRADSDAFGDTWTPSIFMPRSLSRITLEISAVRVERIDSITDSDAVAEGIALRGTTRFCGEARIEFKNLWDLINAKRGFGWNANPWVWVIEFRRVAP